MAHPKARWRARSASLTISLAVHVAVLAALLASLGVRPPPQQVPMVVQLLPLSPSTRHPRSPRPASTRPAQVAAPSAPPSTPATPVGLSTAVPAPSAPTPLAGGVEFGKARAVLRGALGCSHPELVKLGAAERAACDRKLAAGIDPNVAWPAPIAPEKRAWFDASVAAHNSPSRPPMFGCAMAFSGLKLIKPRRPPHALKMGPLPCFILPPKGGLDDDVDVPPPSKNGPSYQGLPLRDPPPIPDFSGGGGPSH